jgi:hypothetical protein
MIAAKAIQTVLRIKYHHGRKFVILTCGHVVQDWKKELGPGDKVTCRVCVYKIYRGKQ